MDVSEMSKKRHMPKSVFRSASRWMRFACFLVPGIFFIPSAPCLTVNFTTTGGGGQTGAAAGMTGMVMSNGDSWSGGAAGVQGGGATNLLGENPVAANVVFKFDLGSFVSSMNVAYGVGNWTVENIRLTFQYTLYANNTRFGGGAGNFDVFWIANDSWVQGSDKPIFSTDAAGLLGWAGDQSLLAREYYSWSTSTYAGTVTDLTSWTTDKTGDRQGLLTVELGADSKLMEDITTTNGGGKISLYLMAVSDTLGMTIFTGGATTLPTFSFDVTAIPEPRVLGLVVFAGLGFLFGRREKA